MFFNRIRGRLLDPLVKKIEPHYQIEIDHDEIRIRSFSKHAKGRLLSLFLNPYGYLKVKLGKNGVLVHHLVAEIYLGMRPQNLVINHKDCDKINNHPDNLEYVTIGDNIRHAITNGMHVASDSTRMPTYKDGRCKDIKAYKKAWYEANRERISVESKIRYKAKQDRA